MKKVKRLEKKWVDCEELHLITLRGEIDVEFAKNAKKKGKFFFSSFKFFVNFETLAMFDLISSLEIASIFFFPKNHI